MATVLKDLQCSLIFAFFYDLFLTEVLRSHGFNTREVHGVKDLHYVLSCTVCLNSASWRLLHTCVYHAVSFRSTSALCPSSGIVTV